MDVYMDEPKTSRVLKGVKTLWMLHMEMNPNTFLPDYWTLFIFVPHFLLDSRCMTPPPLFLNPSCRNGLLSRHGERHGPRHHVHLLRPVCSRPSLSEVPVVEEIHDRYPAGECALDHIIFLFTLIKETY